MRDIAVGVVMSGEKRKNQAAAADSWAVRPRQGDGARWSSWQTDHTDGPRQ